MATPEALSDRAPLALLYHENSKIHRGSRGPLAESIAAFADDAAGVRRAITGVKTYPGGERIALPPRRKLPRPRRALDAVLAARRSVRAYAARPLPFPLLASLLEHAAGVTADAASPDHPGLHQRLRAWPSGGALYPIEVYVAAFDVEGLALGVYHHHPVDRCLEVARHGAERSRFEDVVLAPAGCRAAPALVVLAGRWERPLAKYGERGYRVLLLDAGHLMENVVLVAASLGLGVCPLAGFEDDRLAALLGVDPGREPPLHAATVGLPAACEQEGTRV